MNKKKLTLGSTITVVVMLLLYLLIVGQQKTKTPEISISEIPAYSGSPYVVLNENQPLFTREDMTDESFEYYGELDAWERCTVTFACIGKDLMPTAEREQISQVKPTAWKTTKYNFIDGQNLYNRCHLIGFQLTGENANDRNLITGTRYMNVEGMLPFENMVTDYIKETGNHVLYRVVPVFEGKNLLASGVTMEAYSVEDNGAGICFYIFAYNVQPGVVIDYATGENWLDEAVSDENEEEFDYVVNTSSGKFHAASCPQADSVKPENRQTFTTTRSQMLAWNFEPAGCCKP